MNSRSQAQDAAYELPQSVVEKLDADGWRLDRKAPWHHVRPPVSASDDLIQGWKLHVSATVRSAQQVLDACAPILVEAGCEFKFALDRKTLRNFNDTRTPRGSSGKFVTVYPRDDAQFKQLAQALDEATAGLEGPRILSDARLHANSLVHYRYGAFRGITLMSNDGSYSYRILDPQGNAVLDRREAFHTPPAWVTDPFADLAADGEPAQEKPKPQAVLLHDRYRITAAIRHANKGGVYAAEDTLTGDQVIIKEGRPHVATDENGHDVRDVIHHEAKILSTLEHLGISPRLVDLFTAQEHAFLVEEKLPGTPLVRWVNEQLNDGQPLPVSQWWSLAEKLTALVTAVHGAGVVLRDLGPNNVMIDTDGTLRLIDLELAHVMGGPPPIYDEGGTPGCSAPEQFRGEAPDYTVDYYSLGASLLFLAQASNPEQIQDEPERRSADELMAARLALPKVPYALPEAMTGLLTALLRERPAERMDPARTATYIEEHRSDDDTDLWRQPGEELIGSPARTLSDEQWDELVDGMVAHLESTVDTSGQRRLWPSTYFGDETEPCAVQYGAGGVLAVLARLQLERPTPGADKLAEQVHDTIVEHLHQVEHHLPGLYFGAAGTALAVHFSGQLIGRPDSVRLARKLLGELPRQWPNPDLTHGVAGVGTALLTLWQATGEAALLPLVAEVADGLVACGDLDAGTWTVPADFDSALAGYTSYGFAHGTAGIAAFLLAAGEALERADLIEVALRCGRKLVELAEHRGSTSVWHEGPGKQGFLTHWCNGASGVGTLLVQLYRHTGEASYAEEAERAARAVMLRRWRSGTAYCHGLAGDADFILDLAEATGDPEHRAWAHELACVLYDRRTYRNGHAVIPNETHLAVTAEFGSGLAGHLAFLLRLRFGGPRMFHPHSGRMS